MTVSTAYLQPGSFCPSISRFAKDSYVNSRDVGHRADSDFDNKLLVYPDESFNLSRKENILYSSAQVYFHLMGDILACEQELKGCVNLT
ncbi:hypothetical protein H920_12085 [Fukomys damarensis]|uniref:Uncharacterized protein n=1 Tax=Fukomys damarensis TaxID=885580 RepID=A0A091D608_FUKDA|nr:hypothetical protein H920_12085 [Fukomys damarensis]